MSRVLCSIILLVPLLSVSCKITEVPYATFRPGDEEAGRPSSPPKEQGEDLYRDRRRETRGEVGMDFDASISRDGKWLLFATTRNAENSDIYLQAVNGTAIVQKTMHPAMDINPRLSPDNAWFAFASNRGGNYDIYVKRLAEKDSGKGEIQVTRSDEDDIHPTWSPDGKRLAYSSYSKVQDGWRIWIVDVFGGGSAVEIGEGLFPEWSPVADPTDPSYGTIVFQKHRRKDDPWYSIWTMKTDGTQLTEIRAEATWALVNPSWSPDGKRLVFASVAKRPAMKEIAWKADDIWLILADGTGLSRVTYDDEPDWDPTWTADGRIFYTSEREGHTNIWSVQPVRFW